LNGQSHRATNAVALPHMKRMRRVALPARSEVKEDVTAAALCGGLLLNRIHEQDIYVRALSSIARMREASCCSETGFCKSSTPSSKRP
jgi:hypothetical protein